MNDTKRVTVAVTIPQHVRARRGPDDATSLAAPNPPYFLSLLQMLLSDMVRSGISDGGGKYLEEGDDVVLDSLLCIRSS